MYSRVSHNQIQFLRLGTLWLPNLIMMYLLNQVHCTQFLKGEDRTINYGLNYPLMTNPTTGHYIQLSKAFIPQFTTTPQVLLTFSALDFQGGNNGYLIEALSITKSGFIAKVTALTIFPIYGLWFTYFAIVDKNIQIDTKLFDYRTSGQMPENAYIQFTTSFEYLPYVALFVNGVIVNRPADKHYYFQANVVQVFKTQFQVALCDLNCAQIKYFQLAYIAGSSTFIQSGMNQQSPALLQVPIIVTSFSQQQNSFMGGIAGLADDQSQFSGATRLYAFYTNQSNQLTYVAKSVLDSIIINYTLSYFIYTPCIQYCDYCIGQTLDQCNQCISTTFRINPPQCNCKQSYYNDGSNINCLPCSTNCLTCISYAKCTLCNPILKTVNPPTCNTCPDGMQTQLYYYQILLYVYMISPSSICLNCPQQCLSCTSTQCLMCTSQCSSCNLIGCLSCKPNFYLNNNQCLPCQQDCLTCTVSCINSTYLSHQNSCFKCIPPCQSCISKAQCLSCIDSNTFIDNYYQCIQCDIRCNTCNSFGCLTCYKNYQLNSLNECVKCEQAQCLACSGMLAISTQVCLYVDCSDGIWEYGEQCNNNNPRSGCSDCQISPGYVCQNNLLQLSKCKHLPDNCLYGKIIDDTAICISCSVNYYLKDGKCLQCSSVCLGCLDKLDNCIQCAFPQFSVTDCQLCESYLGYYSDYINLNCYTICGDGIVAGLEQCDLGYDQLQSGCQNCQPVLGYQCDRDSCFKIIYPIPVLFEITRGSSLYNNTKIFQLSYNVPIITNISQLTIIEIENIRFNFQWITIDNQTHKLYIQLQMDCIQSQIKLKMENNLIISGSDSPQIRSLSKFLII